MEAGASVQRWRGKNEPDNGDTERRPNLAERVVRSRTRAQPLERDLAWNSGFQQLTCHLRPFFL
jgi:hypothetical protein